jgi:hypothetical protein
MPLSLKNFRIFRWLFRLFKYSSILLLIVIVLVSLVLVLLPTAVSTDWSHRFIQDNISNALDRPVDVEKLEWSWSDGIIINKLEIPDSPDFSKNFLVSLEHVALKINVKQLLHRKISLEFLLSDLNANIIKNSSGKLNIETLGKKDLAKEKPPAPPETEGQGEEEKDDKNDKKPFALPIDVSAKIRLNGINLLYDDREQIKKYKVKDLEVTLDAPSVKTAPINLTVGTNILVNDQAIPRSTINASIINLFNSDGILNINGLIANLDAKLPGVILDIAADMPISKIKSKIQINLASVMEVAVPLIPDFPSPTEIKGTIELSAVTGTRPDDPLAFDATLSGSDLVVSGKIINGKSIGPGNFNVHLNGSMDLQAEKLDLKTGEIYILENSFINVSGRVEQIKQDNKEIHLAVSPLYLDINEIIAFARPFIPTTIETDHQGQQAAISLKELTFDGFMPCGLSDVVIDEFKINLPHVGLIDEADEKSVLQEAVLQVSGTRVNLKKLTATLVDLFPESAALKLSIAIDKLLNGNAPNEINISDIRLDQLYAKAINIQKTDESKFGMTAELTLDNKLKIGRIHLPDMLQINDLEQSIKVNASLRPDETIAGSLDHLDVTAQKVSIVKEDIGPINLDTGINMHLAFNELVLKNLDPINADIKNFLVRMSAADAVSLTIDASAVDLANTSFIADIKVNADLEVLINKLPEKLLSGINGEGNLNISIDAAGRRPDAEEIDALKKKQFSDNLEFIDHLNFGINIENGSVEISKQDQSLIAIKSITASPLFSYKLSGKAGKGDIISSMTAASLNGLPGINPDTPLSAQFSLSASHDYAKTINLDQSLTVSQAGIEGSLNIMEESINITVDGLDRIITRSPMPKLGSWLSKAGADISVNINIPDCTAISALGLPALSETALSGQISAGVTFALIPDQSIDSGLALTVNDMNLNILQKMSIEKANANIDFSKSYRIQSTDKALAFSNSAGLSANVIDSAWQSSLFTQNSEIYRHIRQLYERMNPKPAFSFQKADVLAAPFPLIIDESMVMLNLDNGLPNLDYFQFNLLGGTINGSIALLKKQVQDPIHKNKTFNVNTALTFSGINFAQFFPGAFSKDDYSKANISGSLYAAFPVTDQLQTILENATITVAFTQIGSMALERLLYSIDPYESNEAIVSQRRLLKNGSPKKIRLDIKDGFLSLRGNVSIKGIEFSLPAIRRLNIAQVPGLERFEEKLSGLAPVISILQKVSAEHIVINKQTKAITFE